MTRNDKRVLIGLLILQTLFVVLCVNSNIIGLPAAFAIGWLIPIPVED